MPLSSDPAARQRQLANLELGGGDNCLTHRQVKVLVHLYVQCEMSCAEVAELMHISEHTANNYLRYEGVMRTRAEAQRVAWSRGRKERKFYGNQHVRLG